LKSPAEDAQRINDCLDVREYGVRESVRLLTQWVFAWVEGGIAVPDGGVDACSVSGSIHTSEANARNLACGARYPDTRIQPKGDVMAVTATDPIKIIFAILLPPLGVFLEVGLKGHFWLSILLTLLGFIPGVIHALYVILNH
jgi:uncharacterized membrane protein YqaE (UPF0057 family)